MTVNPSGPTPYTLFYNPSDTSKTWQDGPNGDAILRTGAGYWNMSTREYGRFIAHLTHGKIVSAAHFKWMHQNVVMPANGGAGSGLGIWVFPGKHGSYLGHNGGITLGNGAGAYGGWMSYPDGTSAVFLANSDNVSGKEPEFNILMPAYDAAVS